MAKFKVVCYYTYAGISVVEADSIEDAYSKGYDECDAMGTNDLEYIGFSDARVIPYTEDGMLNYDEEKEF